ncbi:MAG: hypothetical protein HZA51_15645 [Planctomycetes bacterium]|nr:hypothetical protein [Planctomycetota bacterium]
MIEIEKTEDGDVKLRETVEGKFNEVTVTPQHLDIVADAFGRMVKPDSPASKIQVGN